MKERKKIRLTVILLIVMIILITICLKSALTPKYPEVDHWEKYVIQPGDTLWTIVPNDNEYDIRVIIDMVEEHNNITANIRAYDVIELPVW